MHWKHCSLALSHQTLSRCQTASWAEISCPGQLTSCLSGYCGSPVVYPASLAGESSYTHVLLHRSSKGQTNWGSTDRNTKSSFRDWDTNSGHKWDRWSSAVTLAMCETLSSVTLAMCETWSSSVTLAMCETWSSLTLVISCDAGHVWLRPMVISWHWPHETWWSAGTLAMCETWSSVWQ